MTIETIREKLLRIFLYFGTNFVVNPDEDVDLQEYIGDSLQYITAIAEIENVLDVDLPDELLVFTALKSFCSFSEAIFELVQEKNSE